MAVLSARIGEIINSRSPDILEALALGSCVAVFLYDNVNKVGACAHILLPEANQYIVKKDSEFKPGKYADLAIPELVRIMLQKGGKRERLTAKIAGGARMFELTIKNSTALDVGKRNLTAVRNVLKEVNIPIVGDDTGLDYGRTVSFDLETGILTIKLGLTKVMRHV